MKDREYMHLARRFTTLALSLLLGSFATATAQPPGTLKWTFTVPSGWVSGATSLGSDGTIYFATDNAGLHALYPDGTSKWTYSMGPSASLPVIAPDGTLYSGSSDGYYHAVNPDGTLKWRYLTQGGIYCTGALAQDGTVYAGSDDGRVYALNPDGTKKWDYHTGGIVTALAVGATGTVYVGSWNGVLRAFSPGGAVQWMFSVANSGVVDGMGIATDGTLYAGFTNGTFYALDTQAGEPIWSRVLGGYPGRPAIAVDGTVYVGCENTGKLHALEPAAGATKWVFDTGGSINHDGPTVGADGTIYIGSDAGKLYALTPAGVKRWEYAAGGAIRSFPMIGPDGVVYFGSQNAKLHAVYSDSYGLAASSWPTFHHDPRHTSRWTPVANLPPVANAGPDETVHVGQSVTLDGSASSDPNGDRLFYQWSLVAEPDQSAAVLTRPTDVNPSFLADQPGNYTIRLVVTDIHGLASTPDTTVITTTNSAPVAAAGEDQLVFQVGTVVMLDGSQSYDLDGDALSYAWTFVSKPSGSSSSLTGSTSAYPTFVPDQYGEYIVRLTASDTWTSSEDEVTVSFSNLRPVASAGPSLSGAVGMPVTLDGSGSSDANGDGLLHEWSILSTPAGSLSMVASPTSAVTFITPDLAGTYVIQLVVNDGWLDSLPSSMQVEAVATLDGVVQAIGELQEEIAALAPGALKNRNMRNALLNKLNAVIGALEAAETQEALSKLVDDILKKTDGCSNTNSPDNNDWIVACSSQAQVYPSLVAIIEMVEALL